jgi:hypothetical protein
LRAQQHHSLPEISWRCSGRYVSLIHRGRFCHPSPPSYRDVPWRLESLVPLSVQFAIMILSLPPGRMGGLPAPPNTLARPGSASPSSQACQAPWVGLTTMSVAAFPQARRPGRTACRDAPRKSPLPPITFTCPQVCVICYGTPAHKTSDDLCSLTAFLPLSWIDRRFERKKVTQIIYCMGRDAL